MSRGQRESARALLPSLHYLAAEALRSGCHDVSRLIFDAISHIELMTLEEGESDEQRDLCASRAIEPEHAH